MSPVVFPDLVHHMRRGGGGDSPHERIHSYSFRVQQVQLHDGDTGLPLVVARKYLVGNPVHKVHVARQPVDGHVLHVCGGTKGEVRRCKWASSDAAKTRKMEQPAAIRAAVGCRS